MLCLLHIETSAACCSVALSANGAVCFEKTSFEEHSHAAVLGVYIKEALAVWKGKPDAVSVSAGPGSYTGLRIGVAMAKGLCFGFDIPLLGIPTLEILAAKAISRAPHPAGALYCAMLDARKMDVYAALYDANRRATSEPTAGKVSADAYASYLESHIVYFFGSGAAKCKSVIVSPRAVFLDDIYPLATDMIPLAEERFHAGRFDSAAYFEPYYLTEFTATAPKNKVIKLFSLRQV